MRRISRYIISFLCLLAGSNVYTNAQDTLDIPLKMRAGIDLFGPAMYLTDNNILSAEGYFSIDLNEKRSVFISAGYLNYKYSQPDFEYLNKGIFFRTGIDFNLLKPEKALGKYYTGIGLLRDKPFHLGDSNDKTGKLLGYSIFICFTKIKLGSFY